MDQVAGRVDRSRHRRVVRGRVAEAANGDRIAGPITLEPQASGTLDGEGDSERARQVRPDRRCLRYHRQRVVAEDLVPAARDGLRGRCDEPAQHVPQRVLAGHLRRTSEVERSGPVVQQRWVSRSECRGDGGIALVAGRADRVEAPSARLQRASGEVELAAAGLRVKEGQCLGAAQRRAFTHGRPQRIMPRARRGWPQGADDSTEVGVDLGRSDRGRHDPVLGDGIGQLTVPGGSRRRGSGRRRPSVPSGVGRSSPS